MILKTQILSSTLQYIKEDISRNILNILNKIKIKTVYQNLWSAVKAGLRVRFIGLNAYIKTEKRYKINNFSLPLQETITREQTKSKVGEKK